MLATWLFALLTGCERPPVSSPPALAWASEFPGVSAMVYVPPDTSLAGWTVVWQIGPQGTATHCAVSATGTGWQVLTRCDPTPADLGSGAWGLVVADATGVEGGRFDAEWFGGDMSLAVSRAVSRTTWRLGACGRDPALAEQITVPGERSTLVSSTVECGARTWSLASMGAVEALYSSGAGLFAVTRYGREVELIALDGQPQVIRSVPAPPVSEPATRPP